METGSVSANTTEALNKNTINNIERIRIVPLSWTYKTSTKTLISGITMRKEVNTYRLYIDVVGPGSLPENGLGICKTRVSIEIGGTFAVFAESSFGAKMALAGDMGKLNPDTIRIFKENRIIPGGKL